MPTLSLRISPPQDAARHRSLAAALTALTAETLGKRAAVTAVLIDELPASRWHIGAQPLAQPSAWLEICITAGTNSEAQKARFVAAAHAELQRQLAPGAALAPASYVIVREIPATDWGYAGLTQRARSASIPAATASAAPQASA